MVCAYPSLSSTWTLSQIAQVITPTSLGFMIRRPYFQLLNLKALMKILMHLFVRWGGYTPITFNQTWVVRLEANHHASHHFLEFEPGMRYMNM